MAGAPPEQKTLYAQPAPNLPPTGGGGGGGGASRTQSIDASGGGINSTVFVPGPSAGMGLSPQALAARQMAAMARKTPKKVPPKPLFWVGWALIGVCLGMLLHVLFTN